MSLVNDVERKGDKRMSTDKCPECGGNMRQFGYTLVCDKCEYQYDI